jgi:hypothetical protein
MRGKSERKIGEIPFFLFKEGNKYVAYSPAINLSTCGNTEEQARTRFAEAANVFIGEIIRMGTFEDVLTECGWRKVQVTSQSSWSPPVYRQESIKIQVGAC